MAKPQPAADFDTAIIGGGPAGLSAAVVLGRCRRRVVLFDHGRPRNDAAQGVRCYLGHDGISPHSLRDCGRTAYESGICCPPKAVAYGPFAFVVTIPRSRAMESGSIVLSAPVSTRAI